MCHALIEFWAEFPEHYRRITCGTVVLATGTWESTPRSYIFIHIFSGGCWGNDFAYFMAEYLDGAFWYMHHWHHLSPSPYSSYDLKPKEGKCFFDVRILMLFLCM